MVSSRRLPVAVVGAGDCSDDLTALATAVGAGLARAGAIVLTGGRGGVMAAASAGARQAGGLVVAVLPGADATQSPPADDAEVALFTGMGQARNVVLVLSAAVVVAVGGGWGTLSEIATALKHGIPVVGLASWELRRPDGAAEPLLHRVDDAPAAVDLALRLGNARR